MSMKKLLGISLCLMLLIPARLCADDGFLGSQGGNVYLSKSSSISMVKELVRIKMTREKCYVNCTFWFVNLGNDTTVTVGFPNYSYNAGSESRPLSAFKCQVNGHSVKVWEKKEIWDADSIYESGRGWFSWQCQFKHNDTTMIENAYTGIWGGSVIGTKDFDYVLGTGESWYGPIGQGTIIFDHSDVASSLFLSFVYDTTQIHLTQHEDSAIFEFRNLAPTIRELIRMSLYCFWSDPYKDAGYTPLFSDTGCVPNWECASIFGNTRMSTDAGRAMIYEIYAREGCIFNDESLRKRFSVEKWYKPDSSFTAEKLNKYEIAAIGHIKRCFIDKAKYQ